MTYIDKPVAPSCDTASSLDFSPLLKNALSECRTHLFSHAQTGDKKPFILTSCLIQQGFTSLVMLRLTETVPLIICHNTGVFSG